MSLIHILKNISNELNSKHKPKPIEPCIGDKLFKVLEQIQERKPNSGKTSNQS